MTLSIIVCVVYLSTLNLAISLTLRGWPINKVIKTDTYEDDDGTKRYLVVMESRYTGDVQMGDHPERKYAQWKANSTLHQGNAAKVNSRRKKRSLKKISEGKF